MQSEKSKSKLQAYSTNTRVEISQFQMRYPNKQIVVQHFSPAMWADALQNPLKWAQEQAISLRHINNAYNTEQLAEKVVLAHFVQLYRLSGSRDTFDTPTATQAAALFCARYSNVPISAVVVYFSEYISDWKKSLSAFDASDIIKQFKVFWDSYRQRHYTPTTTTSEPPMSAEEGRAWSVAQWKKHIIAEIKACTNIHQYAETGNFPTVEDVMQGKGMISREELEELEREYAPSK